MDASSRIAAVVYFVGENGPQNPPLVLRYHSQNGAHHPFPSGTQGFIYYHRPPDKLPTAGSVRFRITESEDPASCMSGKDLLLPTGLTWRLPIMMIARAGYKPSAGYELLRQCLLTDKLITPDELEECAATAQGRLTSTSQIVQSLDDSFYLRFTHRLYLHIAADETNAPS